MQEGYCSKTYIYDIPGPPQEAQVPFPLKIMYARVPLGSNLPGFHLFRRSKVLFQSRAKNSRWSATFLWRQVTSSVTTNRTNKDRYLHLRYYKVRYPLNRGLNTSMEYGWWAYLANGLTSKSTDSIRTSSNSSWPLLIIIWIFSTWLFEMGTRMSPLGIEGAGKHATCDS